MADVSPAAQPAADEPVPDLNEKQLARLVDMVYDLLRRELLVERERRGDGLTRGWR